MTGLKKIGVVAKLNKLKNINASDGNKRIISQQPNKMRHIFKCIKCNKYTMKETCSCGSTAMNPKPLKYSPDDKFAEYKRKAKFDEYAKRGLI